MDAYGAGKGLTGYYNVRGDISALTDVAADVISDILPRPNIVQSRPARQPINLEPSYRPIDQVGRISQAPWEELSDFAQRRIQLDPTLRQGPLYDTRHLISRYGDRIYRNV